MSWKMLEASVGSLSFSGAKVVREEHEQFEGLCTYDK
jgi:hypothetical protein